MTPTKLPESVVTFVQQEQARLQKNGGSVHFQSLVPAIERAYVAAFAAIPKPVDDRRQLWLVQALALSHRSFLVAMSTIARGQPDDALNIMRNALEASMAAFAIGYDEGNWKKWHAFEERLQRWKDRHEGKKPKPISFDRLRFPKKHAVLESVGKWRGMLSDSLHFSPDFTDSHEPEMRPSVAFVHYFTEDPDEIDRALRTLAVVHCHALQLFDEALGGVLRQSQEWRDAMRSLAAIGAQLTDEAGAAMRKKKKK